MNSVFIIIAIILFANLLPPLAKIVLATRFEQPLDAGRLWTDGRPILGPHKTGRGVIVSLLGNTAFFTLLGFDWLVIATATFLALLGDLSTSFIKRRLNLFSGKAVIVFDQLLECLLPALYLSVIFSVSGWEFLLILCICIPLTYLGSNIWAYLFYKPSPANYPRIIRSTARMREWRARHMPRVRWQTLLNFENFIFYRILIAWSFRLVGLYHQGVKNTLQLEIHEETFWFEQLPPAFDGFTIMLLTDLHLDGLDGLTDKIIDRIREVEVDLCLIGGDIRMELYGAFAPSLRQLRRLVPWINSRHQILGVLGNHDCIEMVPDLEEAGIMMLINDATRIEHYGTHLWVVGVDDPHYYKVHDLATAFQRVPADDFKIFLAHSPEVYKEVSAFRPQLYLCGHTHGGQIRLPGRGPLFTHCRAPQFTAEGKWQYNGMPGYTSRGAGASGVPLRFNCPGEISVITLKRGPGEAGNNQKNYCGPALRTRR